MTDRPLTFFDCIAPLASVPIIITPDDHAIRLWNADQFNPFGRVTITGSVQAFGAIYAHNITAAYRPEGL